MGDIYCDIKQEALKYIEGFLAGKIAGPQVAQWALTVLADNVFSSEHALLEDTLVALACLHDQDERLDTAAEDIEFLRDCLLGKKEYQHKTEVFFPKRTHS